MKSVELQKVEIRRVIGPTPNGAAVLLGNEQKTFVVFVGFFEGMALVREINGEKPPRPLTHELLQSVFLGFDVEVKQVIISSIIDSTFCATLVLQQKLVADNEEWTGKRNEVRIDARPSDCLVLALKCGVDIHVTQEVFDQVQDVSNMTSEEMSPAGFKMESVEIEFQPGGEAFPGLSEADPFDESDFNESFGLGEDDDDGDGDDDNDDDSDDADRARDSFRSK